MKQKVSVIFFLSGILFASCMLIANILAAKIIVIGPWSAPAGVLIFPIAYILNDLIVEVWGYAKARLIIWSGFGVNILAAIFYALAIAIPSPTFYHGQEAFQTILGSSVRLVFSSFIAYLSGSFLNAFVMSKIKVLTKGKNFSFRAIFSTLIGEGADSILFIGVGFAGIFPFGIIVKMMITQALIKTVYEIIVLPLTIFTVKKIKKIEGEDTYDENISYNPFRLNQIK